MAPTSQLQVIGLPRQIARSTHAGWRTSVPASAPAAAPAARSPPPRDTGPRDRQRVGPRPRIRSRRFPGQPDQSRRLGSISRPAPDGFLRHGLFLEGSQGFTALNIGTNLPFFRCGPEPSAGRFCRRATRFGIPIMPRAPSQPRSGRCAIDHAGQRLARADLPCLGHAMCGMKVTLSTASATPARHLLDQPAPRIAVRGSVRPRPVTLPTSGTRGARPERHLGPGAAAIRLRRGLHQAAMEGGGHGAASRARFRALQPWRISNRAARPRGRWRSGREITTLRGVRVFIGRGRQTLVAVPASAGRWLNTGSANRGHSKRRHGAFRPAGNRRLQSPRGIPGSAATL